jgi:D-alanyl-D-alanine carboxypeptidase
MAIFILAAGFGGVNQVMARQYASIIIDAGTGAVLHAENAELKNRPASLTKMMTLYLTFEALRDGRLSLKQPLPVSKHAASQSPTKLNLKPGGRIPVESAILATLTKSANDAAVVLAETLGGSEPAFARKMTEKAHTLGMYRTQFRNASGLPHDEQVTTARDMAILGNALYTDFPEYSHYFATPEFRWSGNVYRNHNRLLGSYRGVDGIKTGYTNASGFNLVTSVRRDGRHVFAVVLGGTTSQARDNQMRKLLDSTFGISGKDRSAATASKGPAKAKSREKIVLALAAKPKNSLKSSLQPSSARRWSIQVGTFKAHDRARATAQQATRVAPNLLQRAGIKIETVNKSNKVLYRARFTGLTEESARRSCRILESKNFSCQAML